VNNNQSAGSYRVIWDGKDNHGKAMPSGVFIYEFKTDGFVQSNKMIMMK